MSDLQVEDTKVGEGAEAQRGNVVTLHYTGTLSDGSKFDSSRDRGEGLTFQLGAGQVIQGWDEGLIGMKVGGRRRLEIPSELAYGKRGAGNVIGPDQALVFVVDLVEARSS